MLPLWLTFSFKDALDIALVAVLLFYGYRILIRSASKALFYGIFTFFVILLVANMLGMQMMGKVLENIVGFGAIALVVIFQEEIRKFLFSLGSSQRWKNAKRLLLRENRSEETEKKSIAPIVLACMNMAKKKSGALIAIQEDMDLANYIHTGEMFVADINARLIENIFFKNSPLHDGAMIIADGRIRAAGCILPVSNSESLSKDFGLRHRSALGLSQETDAKVIIISEERGKISFAHNGIIQRDITIEELRKALES